MTGIVTQDRIQNHILNGMAIVESTCFIYIFFRILTIPQFSYRISLYRGIPSDVIIALGVAGAGILLVSMYNILLGRLFLVKFLLTITILPFSVVKFHYLTRDSIMHIGRLKSILTDGTVPASNIYPAMHIESAFITRITGLSPTQTGVIFVIFGTVALASLIIISIRRISISQKQEAIFLFLGLVAVFGRDLYNFAPWGQLYGIYLLLVIFFITFRPGQRLEWAFALLFIIFGSVFTHPLTSLVIVGVLTLFSIPHTKAANPSTKIRPILPLLALVSLLSWVIQSPQIKFHIRNSVVSLLGLGSGHSSTLGTAVNTLSSANVTLLDAISTAVARYGPTVGTLGLMLSVLALRWVFLGQRNSRYESIAITVVLLWLFGIAALVLPIPFGAGRLWLMAIVIGLVVVSSDFRSLRRFPSEITKPLIPIVVIGMLLLSVVAGATVYHSGFDRRPSSQISAGEYEAAEWLFTNRGDGQIQEVGMPIRQMIAYVETSESFAQGERPEAHFTGIRTTEMEGYLVVAPPARQIYPKLYTKYREAWSFTPADYRYLESAAPINRIYTSGNTTVYYR